MKSQQYQRTSAVWAPTLSRVRIVRGYPRRSWFRATKRSSFAFIFIFFFSSTTIGQQANFATSTVQGTVFFRDSAGRQIPVAGAKVVLTGETTLETATDETGEFALPAVPLGIYSLEAVA